jgi:tetratricopeptide (TPR) repeat protein
MRFDVWMGMGRVQVELGDFDGALATLEKLRAMTVAPDRQPPMYLLRARAFAGADSTERAIAAYTSVVTRFGRGVYGAEANFRLGEVFEGMDSLKTAQRYYQEVPKAYSSSEFAEEAIKRSGDIGRVLRLQETQGDDSPEAIAMRTFSMAEIQLFQFNNTEKAIPSYEKIITDYPESEYAAKSAYALGYIYGVVLQDSVKAREWYDVLKSRYPESEQTQLAYAFYKGATPPPPLPELMKYATPKAKASSTPTTPGQGGVIAPVVAPRDSTAATPVDTTRAPADTTRAPAPVPAPVDTSTAPADTTGGG